MLPTRHRSFILRCKSDDLASHWCLIDRDHFLLVKFEELTENQDWMNPRIQEEVLDWSVYLKERAKTKLKTGVKEKISVATLRLRFNLMVNFVASEIVLTSPFERHNVVGKFIRVAWVSLLSSFFN
jgi:hypothetical protein